MVIDTCAILCIDIWQRNLHSIHPLISTTVGQLYNEFVQSSSYINPKPTNDRTAPMTATTTTNDWDDCHLQQDWLLLTPQSPPSLDPWQLSWPVPVPCVLCQDESTQPGQNNNSPTTPSNNDDSQTMTNAEKYVESIVQLWSILAQLEDINTKLAAFLAIVPVPCLPQPSHFSDNLHHPATFNANQPESKGVTLWVPPPVSNYVGDHLFLHPLAPLPYPPRQPFPSENDPDKSSPCAVIKSKLPPGLRIFYICPSRTSITLANCINQNQCGSALSL